MMEFIQWISIKVRHMLNAFFQWPPADAELHQHFNFDYWWDLWGLKKPLKIRNWILRQDNFDDQYSMSKCLNASQTSPCSSPPLPWPSKTLTHWLPSSPAWSVPQFAFLRESRVGDVLWPLHAHWLLLLLPPTADLSPSCLGFFSFWWPKKVT